MSSDNLKRLDTLSNGELQHICDGVRKFWYFYIKDSLVMFEQLIVRGNVFYYEKTNHTIRRILDNEIDSYLDSIFGLLQKTDTNCTENLVLVNQLSEKYGATITTVTTDTIILKIGTQYTIHVPKYKDAIRSKSIKIIEENVEPCQVENRKQLKLLIETMPSQPIQPMQKEQSIEEKSKPVTEEIETTQKSEFVLGKRAPKDHLTNVLAKCKNLFIRYNRQKKYNYQSCKTPDDEYAYLLN